MAMDAERMAQELLESIGGEVTDERGEAFVRLCAGIIRHLRESMVVTSQGSDSRGDIVTVVSTRVQ